MRFAASKFDFLLANLALRPPAVVDIDTRSVPLDDLAVRVSQWPLLVQHPAIRTVRPPDTRFELKRLAALEAGPPFRDECVDVVRVDRRRPFPSLEILQSHSDVFEPT